MVKRKKLIKGQIKVIRGKRYKLGKTSRWERGYKKKIYVKKKHSGLLHGLMGAAVATVTTGGATMGAGAIARKMYLRGGHNIYASRLAAAKHPTVVIAGWAGMGIGMVGAATLSALALKRRYKKQLESSNREVRKQARLQIASGLQSSTTGGAIGGIIFGPVLGTMHTLAGFKGMKASAKHWGRKMFGGQRIKGFAKKVSKPFKIAAGRWRKTAGHQGTHSYAYKKLVKKMKFMKRSEHWKEYKRGYEFANMSRIFKNMKQQKNIPVRKRMYHFIHGKPWVSKIKVRKTRVYKPSKGTPVYGLEFNKGKSGVYGGVDYRRKRK